MIRSGHLADSAADFLTRYSGWLIVAVLIITGLLVLPFVFLTPDQQASQDPGGPVFDLQEKVNQRFPARIHVTSFILEDREGDVLTQRTLWELYQNEERVRNSDLGALLYNGYDVDNQRQIIGMFTIADAVQNLLLLDPRTDATLETATEDQVKEAIHRILSSPAGENLLPALSQDAFAVPREVDSQTLDYWQAAAMLVIVASDNQRLGGGAITFKLSNDEVTLGKERFNRQIQELLRGEQRNFQMWGIVVDPNLAAKEQGRTALPFVVATIILVPVVVALSLRSMASLALTLVGLLMLLIWLKGLSNLMGLKASLTLDLIVPIAMISLGVDFFIHAVARYQEERRSIPLPGPALRAGFVGVLGALSLAMLSDGVAFLANLTSGIETVVGFGLAAGIAVFSGYVIMGMFMPLVIMRIDLLRNRNVVGPEDARGFPDGGSTSVIETGGGFRAWIAGLVVAGAQHRRVHLPAALVVTIITSILALQLGPELDVKEFFASDSDLVVGLDKLDRYIAPQFSGEPAVIYLEGDLTSVESLDAIKDLLDRLSGYDSLARTGDGELSVYNRTLLDLLGRVTESDYARAQVEAITGMKISDADQDGLPDGHEQIRAAYAYMAEFGIPLNENLTVYDPVQVNETLFLDGDGAAGSKQATHIVLGILETREQSNLSVVQGALEFELDRLRQVPSISFAGLTGSPFTRKVTLDATTRAINLSLPIAVVACFVLLLLWMRSPWYALVTIIPIGLVVSWLYAFMYLVGFSLNFVTATIAAVSIGVGIDFSIHMTERYRQEMARYPFRTKLDNLRTAVTGTGMAMAGSAASSIIGFSVLSFAPVPIISTYGILTAVMILMAAIASLLVLPSLLVLVPGPVPMATSPAISQAKPEERT